MIERKQGSSQPIMPHFGSQPFNCLLEGDSYRHGIWYLELSFRQYTVNTACSVNLRGALLSNNLPETLLHNILT